jgi:hypothetical protein
MKSKLLQGSKLLFINELHNKNPGNFGIYDENMKK